MLTMSEKFSELTRLGFETAPHFSIKLGEIENTYQEITRQRAENKIGFDIDGLVLSVENLGQLEELGFSTDGKMCPKGQVALKFPADLIPVTIKEVHWSADGGAHLTPVAIFDPVFIEGAEVKRASLKSHRWLTNKSARVNLRTTQLRKEGVSANDARKLAEGTCGNHEKIGVGTKVLIKRSGGVIPVVVSVLESHPTDAPNIPTACPCCGSDVSPYGAFLDCVNADCAGKQANFIGKFLDTLEVKGLGQTTLVEYVDLAGVTLNDFFGDLEIITQKLKKATGISIPVWMKIKAQLEQARNA